MIDSRFTAPTYMDDLARWPALGRNSMYPSAPSTLVTPSNGYVPAGRNGDIVSRAGTLTLDGWGLHFRHGIVGRDSNVFDFPTASIARVGIRRRLLGTWLEVGMVDGARLKFRMKLGMAAQMRMQLLAQLHQR